MPALLPLLLSALSIRLSLPLFPCPLLVNGQLPPPASSPTNITLDDTSSLLSYLPTPTDWDVISNWSGVQDVYNDTLHYSDEPDAKLSFSFAGVAMYYMGTKKYDRGILTVQIDQDPPETFDQYAPPGSDNATLDVLYSKTALDNVLHNVTISNSASDSRFSGVPYMVVDSLILTSSPNSTNSTTTNSSSSSAVPSPTPNSNTPLTSASASSLDPTPTIASPPSSSSGSSSGLNSGALAGIVIGSVAGFCALFALGALLRRGGIAALCGNAHDVSSRDPMSRGRDMDFDGYGGPDVKSMGTTDADWDPTATGMTGAGGPYPSSQVLTSQTESRHAPGSGVYAPPPQLMGWGGDGEKGPHSPAPAYSSPPGSAGFRDRPAQSPYEEHSPSRSPPPQAQQARAQLQPQPGGWDPRASAAPSSMYSFQTGGPAPSSFRTRPSSHDLSYPNPEDPDRSPPQSTDFSWLQGIPAGQQRAGTGTGTVDTRTVGGESRYPSMASYGTGHGRQGSLGQGSTYSYAGTAGDQGGGGGQGDRARWMYGGASD